MGKKTAGTCFVKLDGQQFEVSGGVECPLSDVTREAVMSLSGVAGYKETALKPYIKLSAVFTPDFPLDLVRSNTEMTITAELANGKVYTLSGAWLEGEAAAKGDDGLVDLEFAGIRGIWQ